MKQKEFGEDYQNQKRNAYSNCLNKITTRELEAWKLIAHGYTRESAANQMGITLSTINCHLLNLVRKLNLVDCGGLGSELTRLWIELEVCTLMNTKK